MRGRWGGGPEDPRICAQEGKERSSTPVDSWIPFSAQETALDIDSNRLTHRLSAWDASFMGRLGRGYVALRAMRVV